MGEFGSVSRAIRVVARGLVVRLLGWDVVVEGRAHPLDGGAVLALDHQDGSAPDHVRVVAAPRARFRADRTCGDGTAS